MTPLSEMFEYVTYDDLNSRQKENYNFQKVASRMADHGFNCLRLTDDWEGADFIACHIDGKTFLKVQLKTRLTIDKKYLGKNIFIAFRLSEERYFYDHDALVDHLKENGHTSLESRSWRDEGKYTWPLTSDILTRKPLISRRRDGKGALQ